MALGKGDLPPHDWYDAMADFEEEVNELAYKAVAARQSADLIRRELRGRP